MRATIKEIAKRLNLDPSTVSRALAGNPHISEATRERVIQMAEELNYTPNVLAQNLVGTTSNLIGCMVLEFTNPFYVPMVRAVEDIAEQREYYIFLGESRRQLEMEKVLLERFRRIRVAGVIVLPVMSDLSHIETLEKEGVPVVIVGRYAPGFYSVNVDNQKSGYLVGQYMVAQGHREFGYVMSGNPNNSPEQERLRGLRLALSESGIDEVHVYKVGNNRLQGGEVGGEDWLSEQNRPSAVFCSNDMLAMGFIHKILQEGIKVPDDVSVVGHDDIPFAELFAVSLTTINFPKYEMGRVAMEILLKRINRDENALKCNHIVLEPELIVRNSSSRRIEK